MLQHAKVIQMATLILISDIYNAMKLLIIMPVLTITVIIIDSITSITYQ